jgi:hypothetical protein
MKIGRITRDETAGLHGESNDEPLADIHLLGWAVAAAGQPQRLGSRAAWDSSTRAPAARSHVVVVPALRWHLQIVFLRPPGRGVTEGNS